MMKASKMILFSVVGLISLIILIAAIFVWYNFFDINELIGRTIPQIFNSVAVGVAGYGSMGAVYGF